MPKGEEHYRAFREDLKTCTTKLTRRRSSLKGLLDDMWAAKENPRKYFSSEIAIRKCKNPRDSRINKYRPAIRRMVTVWGSELPYPIVPAKLSRLLPPLPKSKPPKQIRESSMPIRLGQNHPKYHRTRRDVVIADSGHEYRTYRQSKSHSCGPTCCLIVVMNYFKDHEYTEEEMRVRLSGYNGGYKPYNGAQMKSMASMLNDHDQMKARYWMDCTFDDLRQATPRIKNQLYPAIIRIQWNPNYRGGHFIVVAESVGSKFMVLNPGTGNVQSLSEAQLSAFSGDGYWDGRMVTSF
jgi:hypothetical protein